MKSKLRIEFAYLVFIIFGYVCRSLQGCWQRKFFLTLLWEAHVHWILWPYLTFHDHFCFSLLYTTAERQTFLWNCTLCLLYIVFFNIQIILYLLVNFYLIRLASAKNKDDKKNKKEKKSSKLSRLVKRRESKRDRNMTDHRQLVVSFNTNI